jgi:glycosyltransferase involved in cell wall biosynthesis
LSYIIFTPSLVVHDAVSTDVYQSYLCLKEAGQRAVLFAETFDPFFNDLVASKKEVYKLISDPANTLILHHSTFSECGEDLFDQAACKVVIKYHNITPVQFYLGHQGLEGAALIGRLQKGRLQNQKYAESNKPYTLLVDSEFNGVDFFSLSEKEKPFTVVPPFHLVHEMASVKPSPEVTQELDGFSGVKLLYVSRICPNKAQLDLVEVMDQFIRHYGTEIRLYLIGKVTDRAYGQKLVDKVNDLGLGRYICLKENISFPELVTFYQKSSLFLLPSEHEGFGVPIIEAQFSKLPIIAHATTAIPETCGEGALLLGSLDPNLWAAAIHYCVTHQEFTEYLKEKGSENYSKFSYSQIKDSFLSAVKT